MSMQLKIQLVSIVVTAGLFGLIFELLRRKRLMERYALLWLFSSAVLLALAAWRGLLETIASAIGIYYAPSALFVIAFGFILVLLLHFSLVISRLADQNKVLAQRLGLLQERLDEIDPPAPAAPVVRADEDAEHRTGETPVVTSR
ncbi:MAG: hypothetical protein QOD73_3380 [Solirubrobacteraceae bacterium]|nr:hypothetical protein [Solirubrobacteraceae bacterium]